MKMRPRQEVALPCKDFFAYLEKRDEIRARKESGEPKPWTGDPILQTFKFETSAGATTEHRGSCVKNFSARMEVRRASKFCSTLLSVGTSARLNFCVP
jgi:hypothetical protein